MDVIQWIIIGVAMVGSAIIKNGVGIGAGIFMLPFLAMVLPSKLALAIGAPAMLISDIVGLKTYWGEWDAEELKRLVPAGIIGVMVGGYLVDIIPGTWFRIGIGIIAFFFASLQLLLPVIQRKKVNASKENIPLNKRNYGSGGLIFGFLGGVASALAHAGGMIMSMYMLQTQKDKRKFVGTFIFFFAITNLMKLLTYFKIGILTKDIAVWVGVMSPLIIFGGLFGNWLNKRVSQVTFRRVVLIFILVIGARVAWMT
ncbi:MAG: sulfite exporter TauE/SafE family protein [Desulfobacterales bacterium]